MREVIQRQVHEGIQHDAHQPRRVRGANTADKGVQVTRTTNATDWF